MKVGRWPLALGAATFAVVSTSLLEDEISNAKAAEAPSTAVDDESSPAVENAKHFETEIAPLLVRHCVECHGPTSKKGRLDLSQKEAAFAGGESGKAIEPGEADESLLWQYVDADEMPKERPALSDVEKRLLRRWIDDGATWSVETIGPVPAPSDRGENWLRRLTAPEYVETVRSATGVEIEQDARRLLPRDLRADGFSNTAYNLTIDLAHVEAYATLAGTIVDRMDVGQFAAEHVSERALDEARKEWTRRTDAKESRLAERDGDKQLRKAIAGVGEWLLRGPLDGREIEAFLDVATAVANEGGDFDEALGYVIEAMLQSPRFIYRIEDQRTAESPRPIGDYELASRLSYILWGGPPDKELMRAADAGELSDRGRVEAQVERMLQDPRAVQRSLRFIHEWMDLDRLANLRPNSERFPGWNAQLAADMRDETLAFFRHVAWEQQRPLSELLNAQVTFATPRLAAHYGLDSSRHAPRDEAPRRGEPHKRAKRSDGEREGFTLESYRQITDGLEVLYTFEEGGGDTVRDVSGVGEAIDLEIDDGSAVEWADGQLTVKSSTLIASEEPPQRLIEAIKKSNAITIEAWITPDDAQQTGPARIVTLSSGAGQRNVTLGQEGDKYDVRLRTTRTDGNGIPSFSSQSNSVKTRPTQVVYIHDASGRIRIFLDGEQKRGDDVGGDLSNWNGDFRLALANETTKDRAWRGTFHRVAIYSRALSADEIRSQHEVPARYDLTSVPGRGGLLTHASVLTVSGDEASMVTRGLFVLNDLLYSGVEDPPPCVDTTPVPTKPGLTQRAIALERLANRSCSGCHSKFEPLAFGLERFDGIGAYHEADEHGNALRDDGEVLFPGEDEPVAYDSSAELMDLLAESERVRMCITRKVTQFALGRPLVERDEPILEQIHQSAQKAGGTYASLITAIVMSDLVRMAPK